MKLGRSRNIEFTGIAYATSMSGSLARILSEDGFKVGKVPKALASWTARDLQGLIRECKEVGARPSRSTSSTFSFTANSQLSGGPFPCIRLECRTKQADWLGRFAALYAENVLVRNPFDRYPDTPVPGAAREFVQTDIELVLHMKPLMDAGLVSVAAKEFHLCADCAKRLGVDARSWNRRLGTFGKEVTREIQSNLEFRLRKANRKYLLDVEGIEKYLGTDHIIFLLTAQALTRMRIKKVPHRLTVGELARLGPAKEMATDIVNDISLHDWYSRVFNVNYITDRPADVYFSGMFGTQEARLESKAMFDGLSHAVPVLNHVDIRSLLRLRRREQAAFEVYRDALGGTLRSLHGVSDPQVAREAFEENVQPELNKVEAAVVNFRRTAGRAAVADSVMGAGFIGIGLFSGILPPSVGALVAALGGYQFVEGLGDKIRGIGGNPPEARANPYYFLWRATKLPLASSSRRTRSTPPPN